MSGGLHVHVGGGVGVAAGQRVHARLGVPWELWVCSLEGVVITTPSLLTS